MNREKSRAGVLYEVIRVNISVFSFDNDDESKFGLFRNFGSSSIIPKCTLGTSGD